MLANNIYYGQDTPADTFVNSAKDNIGPGSSAMWNLGLIGIQWGAEWGGERLTHRAQSIASKYKLQLMKPGKIPFTRRVATSVEADAEIARAGAALESNVLKKAIMSEGKKAFSLARGGAFLSRVSGLANLAWLAPMLFGMTYNGFKGIQRLGYELERPEMGGHLTLTTAAWTDRQRSFQKMMMSEYNGRTALGNEAGIYHR